MFRTVLKADNRSLLRATNPLRVKDAYCVHQWLTQQQDAHRADDNLLYEVEIEDKYIMLYIQSETPFNLRGVEARGFVVLQANIPVEMPTTNGTKVAFQVRVLPQKCINSKYVPITNAAERDAWFVQKCAKVGLDITAYQVHQMSTIAFTKNNKTISAPSCVYAGVAEVTNVEALQNMLRCGFGRGKAWGAGLFMTV